MSSSAATVCPQCGASSPAGHPATLCPSCLLKLGFESRVPTAGPETAPYQPRFLVPTAAELAPRFPQLEIQEQIGCGGMGVVYRARQKELDRIVALKILRPDFSPDATFAERFQREARALARLNHPHIVTVHDFGRNDDLFYFVMEFIDGANLRQLEQTGQLTPQQALALVPQVCSALQFAHEQGVVHRDIKPENILITRDGRVKIADFGLAKLAGHAEQTHLTGMWQVMGTPHYMAPEQVEHPTEVDHRADIYSLGVVFYEMLTGELPLGRFAAPSHKAQIDVRLDEVVLRALEKEPERRYQHATDVQTDVEQIRQTPGKKAVARESQYVGFEQFDIGALFGFGANAPHAARYAGEPETVRATVLSDLQVPAKVLLILGIVELLIAVVALFIEPSFGLIVLPSSLPSIWTGLNLKHAENARASMIGSLVSLISLLGLIKLPFVIRALRALRFPAAQKAFTSVPWRESQAWFTIRDQFLAGFDWIQRTARNFWRGCLTTLPSRDTTHAAYSAVREGVVQIPERAAPAGQAFVATIRHPITRAFVGWLFWSVIWSLYCLAMMVIAVDGTPLRPAFFQYRHEGLLVSLGILVCVSWLLGEFVLSRQSLNVCTARLSGQPHSRIAGPRMGLLASVAATGITGILLLGIAAFDQPQRLSMWAQLPASFFEPCADWGFVLLLFSLICGTAAVLLNWSIARWVTRGLLSVALLFPLILAVMLSTIPPDRSPMILSMLPIALATPAILWGFWGSRVIRSVSTIATPPAAFERPNGFSPSVPAARVS